MLRGAKRREEGLNMDVLDQSEDEEERSHYGHCGGGARFGARWQKARSKSHHQLLLMDSVGNGNGVDGDGASEDQEILPLPEYERLSQSARLPDDPDPKNPLLPEYRVVASPPPPPPPMPRQQQKKPAAWRLIEYVRSRHKSGGPGACGSSDGDSRSSDGEKEGDDGGGGEKNKKRSSWLPDRRWPVQGFSGEKEGEDGGGEESKKEEKDKKRSSWLPDRERRWPVQGFY